MKKNLKILTILLISIIIISGCSTDNKQVQFTAETENLEKLTVYTSFYPMYDFTSKIGGEKVNVVCIVPSGIEPHDWEPSASDIAKLEKAKLFIYSGAGLEHWVEDILSSLTNPSLHVVEASKNITLISGHEDNHTSHSDAQDIHEESSSVDPHVWLNPLNAKIQAHNIQKALCEVDPANTQYYEDNYQAFSDELDQLHQEFMDRLAHVTSRKVIVTHEAFGYLCDAYHLEQLGIEGLSPNSEPTPARMIKIIEFAKEHQITTIFFEEMANEKVAKTIASEIHAETAVLSPIEGLSEKQTVNGDDYLSVMRQNLDALVKALSF